MLPYCLYLRAKNAKKKTENETKTNNFKRKNASFVESFLKSNYRNNTNFL